MLSDCGICSCARLSKMTTHLVFPKVLAEIIAQYLPTWQMIPWVATVYEQQKRRLRMYVIKLWQNPNGIDMCIEMNLPMSWSDLSANSNPWAIARLLQHPDKIDWDVGIANHSLPINKFTYPYDRAWTPSPNDGETYITFACKRLLRRRSELHNPDDHTFERIMADDPDIDWERLSAVDHPRGMQLLKDNSDKIIWPRFLTNPGIFEQRRDPRVVKILSS